METVIACVCLFLIFFVPIFIYDFIKKKLYKKDLWHKYSIIINFIISILLIVIGVYILYLALQNVLWDKGPWDTLREHFGADSLGYLGIVALIIGIPYFVNTLLRSIFGKLYIEFFFELFFGLFFIILSGIDIVYQIKLGNTYKGDIFGILFGAIWFILGIYYLVKYVDRLNLKRNGSILYVKHVSELKDDQLDINRKWGSSGTFLFDSGKIIIEDTAKYLNGVEGYLGYVSIVPVYFDMNNLGEYFIDPYAGKKVSGNIDKKLQDLNEPVYKEMIKKGMLSETMSESRRKRIGINTNSLSRRRFNNGAFLLVLAILLLLSGLVMPKLRVLGLFMLVISLPYLIFGLDWFIPNCRRKLVKYGEKIEGRIISIEKSSISNRFSSFVGYIFTVTDGNFIYKSPIVYLNNIFHLVMVGDYVPVYKDDKSIWIDVNGIKTNEKKFEDKYKGLEDFDKHNNLLMKIVKIAHYCADILDGLFFFLLSMFLFLNKGINKRKDK